MSKKPNKKLKRFFGQKVAPSKRFKSLFSYAESAEVTEVAIFFSENEEKVFSTIIERFVECESVVKKSKHHAQDCINILSVLRKFVHYVIRPAHESGSSASSSSSSSKKSAKRTEKHNKRKLSLERIVERSLHRLNKHELRVAGFNVLLDLVSMEKCKDGKLVDLFSSAISLEPLTKSEVDDGSVTTGKVGITDDIKVLSPAFRQPIVSDAIELWQIVLEHVSSQTRDDFAFWFDLVKREYLSVFYPKVCKEEGITPSGMGKTVTSEAFESHCPWEVQKTLIDILHRWSENLPISKCLWTNAECNRPLLMDILRQSCVLPISYETTIQKSMVVFRTWLMSPASPELLGDKQQEHWRGFLKHIALVFLSNSDAAGTLQAHEMLCNDVLDVYGYLCFERENELEPDTWKVLQYTLLETTHTLCKSASPLKFNTIQTVIADSLFHALFLYWMQSSVTTPEMWSHFSEKLVELTNWKQLLSQWKEKTLSLTLLLISMLYKQPKKKRRVRDSVFGMHELEAEAQLGLPPDHPVGIIAWTTKTIRSVWFIVLNILGKPTDIADPTNYTIAISCISEVVELLLKAETRLDPHTDPPIPLFEIFLPWLLETTTIEDRERNRGRLLGYSTLCRLFCRQNIRPLTIKNLSHFYRVLKVSLNTGHSSIVWVIIRYATKIFALGLPGCDVLIPDFLSAIQKLFDESNKTKPPKDVQFKALTMLSSLICFPNHYNAIQIPTFDSSGASASSVEPMSSQQLREKILATFLTALRYPDLFVPRNLEFILNCLCVLIWEEIHNTVEPRKQLIRDCFNAMLEATKHEHDTVIDAALDSLMSLAPIQDKIDAVDPSLKKLFAATLSNNIVTQIERGKQRKDIHEQVVVSHYYTILEWLMEGKSRVLDTASSVEKMFRAVEFGLLGEIVDPQATAPVAGADGELVSQNSMSTSDFYTSSSSATIGRESSKKHKSRNANKSAKRMASSSSMTSMTSSASSNDDELVLLGNSLFELLSKSPSHGSEKVREAAEVFLLTVMAHIENFPSIVGTEQLDSWTSPKDIDSAGKETLYFMYNSSIIFSIQEVLGENEQDMLVRVTTRDSTGKWTWDLALNYLTDVQVERVAQTLDKAEIIASHDIQNASLGYTKKRSVSVLPSDYSRQPKEAPAYSRVKSKGVDMLNEMLHYLSEQHPETQPSDDIFFAKPFTPHDSFAAQVAETQKRLNQQQETEDLEVSSQDNRRTPLPLKPSVPQPESAIHRCRLFLAHFGFLTSESRRRLHFLDNNARFKRSLKELDKINGREVMKIGLIYVKPGQEDQNSILANDTRSPKYAKFLSGIGWPVNLATHAGFMGGLDRKSTTGSSAPYYCNATVEVIFHDITRMPTHSDDPQQIHKKRHVGNDIVHIVWSEHFRRYEPTTISSQFNDVHIIIYPLPSGLYRIQICQKDKVGPFGPLKDGMVLSEDLLAPLVRITAINANRVVRSLLQDVYKKPFPVRAYHISEINQRYKVEKPFEEFLGELFPPTVDQVANKVSVKDIPASARRAYRLSMTSNNLSAAQKEKLQSKETTN